LLADLSRVCVQQGQGCQPCQGPQGQDRRPAVPLALPTCRLAPPPHDSTAPPPQQLACGACWASPPAALRSPCPPLMGLVHAPPSHHDKQHGAAALATDPLGNMCGPVAGEAGLATSALGAALEVQGEELEEDTTEIEEKDDATYVTSPLSSPGNPALPHHHRCIFPKRG
jgi:hypothetical protein